MMKILCPTDFSQHSRKALDYAINLSNQLQAELHIISVFSVPRKASSFVSLDQIIKENTEEDLKKLVDGIAPLIKTDMLPVTKVFQGRVVDIIKGYAKSKSIDVIIMGTQGQNSLRTIIMGSVTRKLAADCTIPVLAIPEDVNYGFLGHKLLLTLDDKELNNEAAFNFPLHLSKTLGINIDILHVSEKGEDTFPFDPFITEYLPNHIGEVVIHEHKDIIAGIKEYAEDNKIGMIMMVRRNRGFFERLFTVGHTADELAKTNIPLLILPE